MKYFLLPALTVLFIFNQLCAQQSKDSTKKPITVNGSISVNNNGIDPVPAFALGEPALMSSIYIKKGNFTYNPQLNYSLKGKPWAVNNWFLYKIPITKRFSFRTGFNLDFFFKTENIIDENNKPAKVQVSNEYIDVELSCLYQLSTNATIGITYWNTHGIEYDALHLGNFVNLSAYFSNIPLGNFLNLELSPSVFFIKNQLPFKGIYVANTTFLSVKKIPVYLFYQAVQPIKVTPRQTFLWNMGINYRF